MNEAKEIGIGIVGGGRVCHAHASSAQALKSTRLAAIAETDPERLAGCLERYGCAGFPEYEELLADPDVDAVVIALPHWLHCEATLRSLAAGKHVLLEKPMAMTTVECDAMLSAAREAGLRLMVAHSQQFFPVNLAARDAIRAGEIGDLALATDTWYKPFYEGVRPPWFLDGSKGGGMWAMNGAHMIDRLCFLLESRVQAVKAKVGSPIFGLSASDMGAAFLEFENGLVATIAHVGYREGVNRFEAEITGTHGQLRLGGSGSGTEPLWISREGAWAEAPVAPLELSLREGAQIRSPVFAAQLQEFARSIHDEREPSIPGEYGRHVVAVLEACEESSREGREVRLP
jgi:phthalate 4,5-cis-dihydrodiol dehydrogenase